MNARYRVLIVDDEAPARDRLRSLLSEQTDLTVSAECRDGIEAILAVHEMKPHIMFLDVQMPEMDGLEVVAQIGLDAVPVIVFVTAYDRYALAAFEARAIDYLLKPFTADRFAETLARARARLQAPQPADQGLAQLVSSASQNWRRLAVRDGGIVFLVDLERISWLQGAGNYVRVHCDGRSGLVRGTLRSLAERLANVGFARISHSAIVNCARVCEVRRRGRGYDVVLDEGTVLRTSNAYLGNLDPLLEFSLPTRDFSR